MHFSTRPRAIFPPQEGCWKQPLLVSVIIHAALLWVATTWWHKSFRKMNQPPQVIEVEVIERALPAPVAPPVTMQAPIAPPVTMPEPVAPTPEVRPSATPFQPQTEEKVITREKPQVPTERQFTAASQAEPAPAMPASVTEQAALPDKRQGGRDTMAKEISTEGSPAISSERTADIRNAYQQQLKELIERNKKYPLIARKGRQQGRVIVEFSLHKMGELGSVQVTQSSGHRLLDRAALQAVRSVKKFPAPPEVLPEDTQFRISINFSLE